MGGRETKQNYLKSHTELKMAQAPVWAQTQLGSGPRGTGGPPLWAIEEALREQHDLADLLQNRIDHHHRPEESSSLDSAAPCDLRSQGSWWWRCPFCPGISCLKLGDKSKGRKGYGLLASLPGERWPGSRWLLVFTDKSRHHHLCLAPSQDKCRVPMLMTSMFWVSSPSQPPNFWSKSRSVDLKTSWCWESVQPGVDLRCCRTPQWVTLLLWVSIVQNTQPINSHNVDFHSC